MLNSNPLFQSVDENPLSEAHRFSVQAEVAGTKGHWQQALRKHQRAAHYYSLALERTQHKQARLGVTVLQQVGRQSLFILYLWTAKLMFVLFSLRYISSLFNASVSF